MERDDANLHALERIAALEEEVQALRAQLARSKEKCGCRQINEELQETNRSLSAYASLVRNAPNAIVVLDREYRFTLANAAFALLHQVSEDEIVGKPLWEVIGREHFALAQPQLDRVFQGETIEFSTWYNYPDYDRFMHVFYYPVRTNGDINLAGVILTDITAQARSEEALRESEERIRALSEATTEGIILHEQGKILEFNQAIVDHFGYSPDELHRMTVLDLTAPQSKEIVAGHMRAGDLGPYQAVSLHKDGSTTIGEIRGRNIIYKGRPIRVVAIRDITTFKQTQMELEQLLHNAEAWAAELDAIISSIADFVIVVDPEGGVRRMNPVAAALGSMVPGSNLTSLADILTTFIITTPEGNQLSANDPTIQRVFRGEAVHGYVVVLHAPDGRDIWLSASANPIRLPDGHQIGFVFTATDITKLHDLQAEAERRAAELDATISSIADGLVIYNTAGTVARMNPAITSMAGFSPEALQLAHPLSLETLHLELPDGTPVAHEQLPHVRALHGEHVTGEILIMHPRPGQTFWISTSAAPIRTPAGELLGAVLTVTDMTQMHQLQQEREVYTHTISHDLRVPLSVIQGHAQLLYNTIEETHLNGTLHASVEAILRSTRRMTVMIQDLVDAARLEGGKVILKRQAVNLCEYLENLLERMKTIIETDRIRLDIPNTLPSISADYDRLERILMNLLTNALKYSEAGTPVVVQARPEGNAVIISVIDQGRGIAPEELPHIFEPFYRVRGERRAEGVGLGLYITSMLVGAHGGHIWVESEPGQGSTFSFTLPTVGS